MRTDVNWFGVLAHHAARTPERPMTVFEGEVLTYAQMEDRARALAGGLQARGVGPRRRGRPALVQLPGVPPVDVRRQLPRCHRHAHQLAAGRTGGPLHPRALGRPGARVRRGAARRGRRRRPPALEDAIVRSCIAGERRHRDGRTLAELEAEGAAGPAGRWRSPTTSTASCTPRAPRAAPRASCSRTPTWPGRTWPTSSSSVSPAPTSASPAARSTTWVRSTSRRPRSSPPAPPRSSTGRSTPRAVVDELERSRVTTVWLAPAMVNAIMALPDVEQRDLSSVRVIINGGEKMPIPLIERIQRTFPSGLVRRRLRPDRDGVGGHLLGPRQHRDQAGQRRPSLPLPRARRLGRRRAVR